MAQQLICEPSKQVGYERGDAILAQIYVLLYLCRDVANDARWYTAVIPTSTLRFRDSGHGRVHGHWTVSLHTRFKLCTFPVEQPVDTSKPAEDAHGASSTSKSDPFPFTDAKLALIALARRKLLPSAHVNH